MGDNPELRPVADLRNRTRARLNKGILTGEASTGIEARGVHFARMHTADVSIAEFGGNLTIAARHGVDEGSPLLEALGGEASDEVVSVYYGPDYQKDPIVYETVISQESDAIEFRVVPDDEVVGVARDIIRVLEDK
jgi:hypothetical protein